MFDQTFVNTQAATRKPWTVAVSLGLQFSVMAAALIVPLFHVESIRFMDELATRPVFMKLEPVPVVPPVATRAVPVIRRTAWMPLFAPRTVPTRTIMTADAPELAFAPLSGLGVGSAVAGVLSGIGEVPAPVVVKSAPAPQIKPAAEPVRISMGTQAAKLIFGPKPVYPQLARTARVQGTVRIEAVISRDGTIRNLQVISGPPLLVAAAVAAVRQWRYQPTLLSSEPVEVATSIEVNFTLN